MEETYLTVACVGLTAEGWRAQESFVEMSQLLDGVMSRGHDGEEA